MLFVYGTLQFAVVLEAVIGRVPALAPAAVVGWRAAALPGRVYPGLVPAAGVGTGVGAVGARAVGQVLSGLTAGEWAALDAFEGASYERRELDLDGGGRAFAYVWLDVDHVAGHDWDPARFAAVELADYVDGCSG